MTGHRTIDVIIPCGRPDRLPELVRQLLRLEEQASINVVVVTHAVPDHLSGSLTSPSVRWVATDKLLPPGAMRNAGARQATGDFFLFLDDDCLPGPCWIEKMVATLAMNPDIGVVGSRVVSSGNDFWSRCADAVLFSAGQSTNSNYRDLMSAAIAVRRKAFEETGGFDDDLLASEDWEFCLRLQRAGWRCYFNAEAEVIHDHRRGNFSAIMRQSYRSGRLSGLTVQERFAGEIGLIAQIMVAFSKPWIYWMVAIPYAVALTFLQAHELRRAVSMPDLIMFFPILLLSRVLYQIGVLHSLLLVRMSKATCYV